MVNAQRRCYRAWMRTWLQPERADVADGMVSNGHNRGATVTARARLPGGLADFDAMIAQFTEDTYQARARYVSNRTEQNRSEGDVTVAQPPRGADAQTAPTAPMICLQSSSEQSECCIILNTGLASPNNGPSSGHQGTSAPTRAHHCNVSPRRNAPMPDPCRHGCEK
jgi:hypothetical protein